MSDNEVLLRVEGLKTYFHTYEGVVRALEGIDFELRKGETLGLVGETGCGKSVTAFTIMGLVPKPPGKIEGGHVFLGEPPRVTAFRREYDLKFGKDKKARQKEADRVEGRFQEFKGKVGAAAEDRKELKDRYDALTFAYDILYKPEDELNRIRGNRISMIFQEPMTALNPAYTIGEQIGETIELHQFEELVEDALGVAERELRAAEQEKVAERKRVEDTGQNPNQGRRSRRSSTTEVCSSCSKETRDDWDYCLSCGARLKGGLSSLVPLFATRLVLRSSKRYYQKLKQNPSYTISYIVRVTPVLRRIERRLKFARLLRAESSLKEVKIAEPTRTAKSYPFELSGGMKQRAMIAMMMSCEPEVLLADEPTTALDVTVETQILALMRELQKARNTSIVLITHDLGVIAENCHRVAVMYAGYIVEGASVRDLFGQPIHPYTNALLKSVPKIGEKYLASRKKPLQVIPGVVPNLLKPPPGCRFHPRCSRALEVCKTDVPELKELVPGHFVACHNPVPVGQKGEVAS